MRKAAILQSAYVPWRGYFDLIASVDEFIFYDDVQFSPGDWRNRNVIKTASGPKWLTIPVAKKNRIRHTIGETEASDPQWGQAHWNRIVESYRKAPHFDEIAAILQPLFLKDTVNLSQINATFIEAICSYLGTKSRISWSWDYAVGTGKTRRLVELCKAVNCTTYVSGPAARSYLEVDLFAEEGIAVEWFSYDALRPYPQLHGDFVSAVSAVDLLFNCGPDSHLHIPALNRERPAGQP